MTDQQLLKKVVDVFDGVILEDDVEVYHINGKSYKIQYDTSRREWSCNCPNYMFRMRKRGLDCKHIKEIKRKKFEFLIK